jgi:hypothetical protein
MTTKLPNGHKYQYTKIFHSKASKIYQNLNFWNETIPSGNPGVSEQRCFYLKFDFLSFVSAMRPGPPKSTTTSTITSTEKWRSLSGWPDWANFRPLDDCFLRANFLLHKKPKFLHYFFYTEEIVYELLQKTVWFVILNDFFANSSGDPGSQYNPPTRFKLILGRA